MTPKLQALYGVPGTWQEVIAAAVQLPPTLPDALRALWAKNTELARTAGVTLEPQQFAEQVVDRNLAGKASNPRFTSGNGPSGN